jgi:hypothetical protein
MHRAPLCYHLTVLVPLPPRVQPPCHPVHSVGETEMGDADPPVSRLETRHGPMNAKVLGGPSGGVLLALGGMGVTGCGPHFLASGVAQQLAKQRRVLLPDVYSAAATRPSLGEFAGESSLTPALAAPHHTRQQRGARHHPSHPLAGAHAPCAAPVTSAA